MQFHRFHSNYNQYASEQSNHNEVFGNYLGNVHFSLATGGYQGVTGQSIGLCDMDFSQLIRSFIFHLITGGCGLGSRPV